MANTKTKRIHYARARFAHTKYQKARLQHELDLAINKLRTVVSRTVNFTNGFTMQIRKAEIRAAAYGTWLHIASYVQGESTTTVPQPPRSAVDADLGALRPPERTDFMDGEVFVLVSGNHALVCSTGISDTQLCLFFDRLIQLANKGGDVPGTSLGRVADFDKVKMIEQHGVKAVAVNASLYNASLQNIKRTTTRKRLLGRVADEISALVRKDTDPDDDSVLADFDAEVIIKVDKRRGAKDAEETLRQIAVEAVTEDHDGFTVILGNNVAVTSSRVSLSKPFSIPAESKGLNRVSAVAALDSYFSELKHEGHLTT